MRVRVSTELHRDDRAGLSGVRVEQAIVSLAVGGGSAVWLAFGLVFSGFVDGVVDGVVAAAASAGSVISAAAMLMTFLRRQMVVPIDGNAEEKHQWVRVRGKSSPFSLDAERPYVYSPRVLARSFLLRTTLRARFGLTLDLGDDSPEVLRPGDPPIAEWGSAAALPEPSERETGGVYRQRASGPRTLRAKSDAAAARALRKHAGIAATVVDEAAIDDTHLYVKEEKDFGSMDLSLLRGAAPLGDGHVAFSFGKFTTVVFPNAKGNPVVDALRERLTQTRERDEHDAVEEADDASGSNARALRGEG
jgi:hypothetical protein